MNGLSLVSCIVVLISLPGHPASAKRGRERTQWPNCYSPKDFEPPVPSELLTCFNVSHFAGLGDLMCANTGAELPLHQCMAKACMPVAWRGACRRQFKCFDEEPSKRDARFFTAQETCAVRLYLPLPDDYALLPEWLFPDAYRIESTLFRHLGYPPLDITDHSEPTLNLILWKAAHRDTLPPDVFAAEARQVAAVQRIAYTYQRWHTEYWDEDSVLLAFITRDMRRWMLPPPPYRWWSRAEARERMRDQRTAVNGARIVPIPPVAEALASIQALRHPLPPPAITDDTPGLEAAWVRYSRALAERGFGFDAQYRIVDIEGNVVDDWWFEQMR